MKLERVVTLLIVLFISIGTVQAQGGSGAKNKSDKHQSDKNKKDSKKSTTYSGSSSSTFATWVKSALSDDLKTLKKSGVRCKGSIQVNYEVRTDGSIKALSHYDTGYDDNRGVDGKINDVINELIQSQEWDSDNLKSKRSYSFTISY